MDKYGEGIPYSGIIPVHFLEASKTQEDIASYIDAQLRGVKAGLIIQWERWRAANP